MLDLIVEPFITILLIYYRLLGENVFLAIVAFTITVRMATMPLTLRSQRSMKAMQDIQPEMKRLQEEYKDNKEALVQKQMELYREKKINPLAGCWPVLIQMPILIGLWQAILATLASTPHELFRLSDRILWREQLESFFGWNLDAFVPMQSHFLWLNLAVPDPYLVLPVLVVLTTWLQQRLFTPPPPKKSSTNPDDPSEQAAQISRQMLVIMPWMFGFFSLTYSSGLSIYFIVSNIIGIVQYSLMGRANLKNLLGIVELSEEEKQTLADYGRLPLDGITDSEKNPQAFQALSPRMSEKRSKRLKQARTAAKQVKLDA